MAAVPVPVSEREIDDRRRLGIDSLDERWAGDDSYRKLPFYAARGVREVLIVHRDRRAELYRRSAEGEMVAVAPARSEVLDVDLGAVLAGLPGDR